MTSDLLFASMPADLAFRPVESDDMAFLFRLYASTREDELALTDWPRSQKDAFLDMQFKAQHRHYETHFPDAAFRVIEELGTPIGRLYVDEDPEEVRVIDIALLPEHRRRGFGSGILQRVLAYAGERGKRVGLHVETFNPALQLYRRLGFEVCETTGPYHRMQWSPSVVS